MDFQTYADVLKLAQDKDDLNALFDPHNGFAPRLEQICRDRLDDVDGPHAYVLKEFMRLEANTWALLQEIMPTRKMNLPPSSSSTPSALLQQNPYTPASTLAQAILTQSTLLTELLVVREWLHDTAPNPLNPGATTGYWSTTKHNVLLSKITGTHNGGVGLVKKLDPDVINRDRGNSHLTADDTNYEKSVVQALFGFIRAGRLEDATELCVKAQQPWRAASIHGSKLFKWPGISAESSDDLDMAPSGNKNRALWKRTCVRAALNSSLSSQDRIFYSALAPSPQTFSILKSGCRTWEDHLWAQICVVCEEKESMELQRLQSKTYVPFTDQDEEDWEKEVMDTLEGLKSVEVQDGTDGENPYHLSQLLIILDRTGPLLEIFQNNIRDGAYLPNAPVYPVLCRFFAHLCLYLQLIDINVPPDPMRTILEAYLDVLEKSGERNLIAMYASALGDNAIKHYANFLATLDLSADADERCLTLTRAREHGLDIEQVATSAAEFNITIAMENLPRPKGPLPSPIKMQVPASTEETYLLRSIEWTTFMESTYLSALYQANMILRYFLACGRVQLAQQLFEALPAGVSSINSEEHDVASTELSHFAQFFVIWKMFDQVVNLQAMELPGMTRDGHYAWSENYKNTLSETSDAVIKLLTTDWLVLDDDQSDNLAQTRRELLARIRRIYIPEVIIRLHSMLFSSRHHVKENIKHVMNLVNIVADSRYSLYAEFSNEDGKRISDYLGAVRQAILGALDGGGDDPFRAVRQ